MIIRDIGTRVLGTEGTAAVFNSFEFKKGDLLPLYLSMDIERPNNVYSQLKVDAIIDGDDVLGSVYHLGMVEIRQGTTLFAPSVPGVVLGRTSVIIMVERVALIFGTSDTAGAVTLTASYDEEFFT